MMKKSPHKLVLRKETLRALSSMELARAVGGNSDPVQVAAETGDKQCPAPAAVMPGG
jgi:hypothetical protein